MIVKLILSALVIVGGLYATDILSTDDPKNVSVPAVATRSAQPGNTARSNDSARLRQTAVAPATPVDTARMLEQLAADIATMIKLPDEIKNGRVGVMVRSVSKNREIFTLNPDRPLTPASTTKVVTTFTALSELGPDFKLLTTVGVANRPKDGVLVGDVYLRGHGDPFLNSSDIDALADQVVAFGIKEIEGNIVGDGTYFDNKYERIEYSGDADVVEDLPPVASLSIDKNVFSIVVSSPRTPGQPCNVQTYPRSSGFEIINEAVSVGARKAPARRSRGKRRSDLYDPNAVTREPSLALIDEDALPRAGDEPLLAYAPMTKPSTQQAKSRRGSTKATTTKTKKGAAATKKKSTASKKATATKTKKSTTAAKKTATKKSTATKTKETATAREATPSVKTKSGLKVTVTGARDGKQTITVTGGLTANRTAGYHFEMKNPALVAAGMLYDRLRARGITITGGPVSAASPSKVKVIGQSARPLTEILNLVMKNSNNYMAEYVFKMIGAAAGARNETAKHSVERIHSRMDLSGVSFDRCIVNDGSGLSRANCISATALSGILSAAHRDRKIWDTFYASMSVAGVDGTLRKRMKGTLAEGNMHGKTGTLRNVSALTGYVSTRDGELMTVAFIMNGGNHGTYRAIQDKVTARIAAFSYQAPAPRSAK